MFDTYADIFDKRGAAYHEAMRRYPHARDAEFETIVQLLEPSDGQVVVDMPSGGGYLRCYLDAYDVRLIAVETTQAFYEQCAEDERTQSLLCDLQELPLADASVDAVVSMAGLHHVDDRPAVFREMHRILKPDGRLCIADVEKASAIDGFLNTFVDRHNSMGHAGEFIDAGFVRDLRQASFCVERDENVAYTWNFDSVDQMVEYCTLMFGLDEATPQQVLDGIRAYQGYTEGASCAMNWALRFVRCTKQKANGRITDSGEQ